MRELFSDVDINETEAAWIAQGMRALAACDGLAAAELALVEQFEHELGIGSTATDDFDPAASPLRGDGQKGVFVRTLVLLAHVDGRVSSRELEFMDDVCSRLGVSGDDRAALEVDAKSFLLSSLSGVEHYRAQAEAVGRKLGLTDEQIAAALS
ncbi:MAG: TerB family tellurite resistance protein [Deltaproteobacteria bacterium]|nr:TerB family tellurite resistance protein [Deltaproteobacteria bacterium]